MLFVLSAILAGLMPAARASREIGYDSLWAGERLKRVIFSSTSRPASMRPVGTASILGTGCGIGLDAKAG